MDEKLTLHQVRMLAELRVPVQVLLGEIEISGEELLDLAAGKLLEMPLSVGQSVSLAVGGEPIAVGELVYDGTHTFIQITQIPKVSSDAQETSATSGRYPQEEALNLSGGINQ